MNNQPLFDKMMELTGLSEPVIKSFVLDDEKTKSRCDCFFKLFIRHCHMLRQDIFLKATCNPFPNNPHYHSIQDLIIENKMPASAIESLLQLRLEQEVAAYKKSLDEDPVHQAILESIKNNNY